MKAAPQHFQVSEIAAEVPSGEGEHLWLHIRKVSCSTPEVAAWLARAFAVPESAVGYAGMKDKRAVAEQWFSVHTPRDADALPARADVTVLAAARHRRKLRRGELAGNAFRLRLTDVAGTDWPARLARARDEGVPNYFGAQRFGHDNLSAARCWLPQRRRRRLDAFRRGLYLSVLRSFLFNEVLGARVAAGNWRQLLGGDVAMVLSGAVAPVPTGPLWGRGRSQTGAAALDVERTALAAHADICAGLEHAGLTQERRSLVLKPTGLTWQADGDALETTFTLPPGGYATALLGEVFELGGAAGATP